MAQLAVAKNNVHNVIQNCYSSVGKADGKALDRGILRSCVTFSPPRARLELKFTTAVVMLAICIMVGLYTWTWSDNNMLLYL